MPSEKYDLVSSQGVLHHTDDCRQGVRKVLRDFTKKGGYACIGLYHKYGRGPFLKHFQNLRDQGRKEEELFAEYRKLSPRGTDETRLRSWFRDQVLHPHETQHTLSEFISIIEEEQCRLIATSINGFAPINDVDAVLAMEHGFEKLARERLSQGRYYTGYFVFLVQKK